MASFLLPVLEKEYYLTVASCMGMNPATKFVLCCCIGMVDLLNC
jgi:hypothetical protein